MNYPDNISIRIWLADGSFIDPRRLSKDFGIMIKKNNLEHIHLHELRHSWSALMLKSGVSSKVTSEALGHSKVGITLDLYSHVLDDMKKEVADKTNAAIYCRQSSL